MTTPHTFTCRDCKVAKRTDERATPGKNWCKACRRAYEKRWHSKNPQKVRAKENTYRTTNPTNAKARKRRYYYRNVEREKTRSRAIYAESWLRYSLRSARKRARVLGIPFDLNVEDIEIPATCPVLGLTLTLGERRGLSDASPTLDRIIPELGYVKNNVAVISKRANTIKNCGTAAEHRRIAEWIESKS